MINEPYLNIDEKSKSCSIYQSEMNSENLKLDNLHIEDQFLYILDNLSATLVVYDKIEN